MNYESLGISLGYLTILSIVAFAAALPKGREFNPTALFSIFGLGVIGGYFFNISFATPGIVSLAVLGFCAYISYTLVLKSPDGIKTGARDLLMFFFLMTILARFSLSYILYGTFESNVGFPSWSSFVNWNTAYTGTVNVLNGNWTVSGVFWFVAKLWDLIVGGISYPVSLFVVGGQVLAFVASTLGATASFVTYPYQIIPFQHVSLAVAAAMGGLLAIALLFSIRIAASGAQN